MEIQLVANNDGEITLTITGSFVISSASVAWDSLKEYLHTARALTLDLQGVEELDTAGFQILVLLKKIGEEKKIPVRFLAHSPAVLSFIELYGLAGFFRDRLVIPSPLRGEFKFSYGMKKRSSNEKV